MSGILFTVVSAYEQNSKKFSKSLVFKNEAAQSLHDFTFKLANEWQHEPSKNFVFSPISLFGTLATLEPGMRKGSFQTCFYKLLNYLTIFS